VGVGRDDAPAALHAWAGTSICPHPEAGSLDGGRCESRQFCPRFSTSSASGWLSLATRAARAPRSARPGRHCVLCWQEARPLDPLDPQLSRPPVLRHGIVTSPGTFRLESERHTLRRRVNGYARACRLARGLHQVWTAACRQRPPGTRNPEPGARSGVELSAGPDARL
jgi:hypothetical protein